MLWPCQIRLSDEAHIQLSRTADTDKYRIRDTENHLIFQENTPTQRILQSGVDSQSHSVLDLTFYDAILNTLGHEP